MHLCQPLEVAPDTRTADPPPLHRYEGFIMKPLLALVVVLLLSAFTGHQTTQASTPQYPSWLEMKPGYAEACISGGGCIPMTQAELQDFAAQVMQRTMQACRRSTTI